MAEVDSSLAYTAVDLAGPGDAGGLPGGGEPLLMTRSPSGATMTVGLPGSPASLSFIAGTYLVPEDISFDREPSRAGALYKGFNSDLTHLGWDQTTLALWDFDTIDPSGAPSVSRVQLYAGIGAGAPTKVVESPSLTRLDDGTFHYFAVTAAPDGLGAQNLHMFVDGVDVAQGVASYSVPVVEAVLLGVGYYNDLRSVAPQPDVFRAPYQANFEVGDVWIDTTRLSSVDLDPLAISHHYLNAAP